MSVVSVKARSFILALFIRDDGERFLLGDNGYDFKGSQLHFAANTIENDEVMKQGADGVMVAGQVRRASVQSFDGYVGDATMAKETIEQMRRDFFAFFVKGHHFRVVYIDCNRNAWQRKGGYLVDAPEVKELWQIHPEYHVGLNFEDVNYYSYDEDADGEEILSNLVDVPVSTEIEGGLVWDEDGAVSEDAGDISYDEETADATPAKNVYITDATEAPLASFRLDGETSQNGTPTPSAPVAVQTITGENVVSITSKNMAFLPTGTKNGITCSRNSDGSYTLSGTASTFTQFIFNVGLASGQAHTLSYTSNMTASGVFLRTRVYAASGTGTISDQLDINSTSRAVSSSKVFGQVMLTIGNGTTIPSGFTIYPQLELGSEASSFEPAQGGNYEINLGKNLANYLQNATNNGVSISVDSEGVYTLNGTATANAVFAVPLSQILPLGGNKTMSFNVISGSVSGSGQLIRYRIRNRDGSYNAPDTAEITIASSSTGTLEKTITNELATLNIWIASGAVCSDFKFTLQLELGTGHTDFAPYFTPIELCKIGDYQDYIYKNGGKWYVHKAVGKLIYNGTEIWNSWYNVGDCIGFYIYSADDAAVIGVESAINNALWCDKFSEATTRYDIVSGSTEGIKQCGGEGRQYIALGIEKSRLSDYSSKANAITSLGTWLSNNPTTTYYALATPTDTEITNEALIAQLEAVLGGRTYYGVNNITTITPNEQGTLEISYYTKYQPMIGSGGYVWGAGGAGGPTVIINNSIDNVSPVWTIYGPTTNPQLENATTGETIEYVGTIAEGQTLTIDMGEQTASLDGLNVISNLVGDFIQLAPGRNNMIYSVSGEAGASELGWSEIVG